VLRVLGDKKVKKVLEDILALKVNKAQLVLKALKENKV